MKNEILRLRRLNMGYNQIAQICNCAKSSVAYHCKNAGLDNPASNKKSLMGDDIVALNEYYKTHTLKDTAVKFGISLTTAKKYCKKKRRVMSGEEKRRKNYDRIKHRRQLNKKRAIEYKGGSCERCGYDKCSWALSFHHLDPNEKDFSISSYSTLSWERIKKELDKCIMVCSNCHAEIHHEEFSSTSITVST